MIEKSNYQKEADCGWHEFEHIKGTTTYKCKYCGCEMDAAFVAGYERGLEHGEIHTSGYITTAETYGEDKEKTTEKAKEHELRRS